MRERERRDKKIKRREIERKDKNAREERERETEREITKYQGTNTRELNNNREGHVNNLQLQEEEATSDRINVTASHCT